MPTTRLLYKQGNSVVMTLPADLLAHVGCRTGDYVEVFKEPRRRLTIRKFHGSAHASSRASPRDPDR